MRMSKWFSAATCHQHLTEVLMTSIPDSKVNVANMGPIWGRQDPGVPQVGPMNFVIWDVISVGY